jgi:branched-chain amino acid transport system permease protein
LKILNADKLMPVFHRSIISHPLVSLVVAVVIIYLALLLGQSADRFLQFSINGVVIGAIYAIVAMGFNLVYGTVWFFDLAYGAMATVGAYSVFYFTGRQIQTVGRGEINNLYLDIFMGILIAGVVAWVLYVWIYPELRSRINRITLLTVGALVALAMGSYTGLILSHPADLNVFLSPTIGVLVATASGWVLYLGALSGIGRNRGLILFLILGLPAALALGAYCGWLVAETLGTRLYLSWFMGATLAGASGLAIYRGVYFYLRRQARSPLVMLVGSLGFLLSITAFISIVFSPDGRPLAQPFGTVPWSLAGAFIKPFQIFIIGLAFAIFGGLYLLLNKTSFGTAVRAIGDDEEVARIVGINTPVVIAVIFFLGGIIAGLGGILLGEDIGIRPQMGLLLLLKGWIASVVGGIGNIYGALLGGFVLGMVENYGVWYIPAQWKDAVAFVLLIFFLSFWPRGLLPRR